MPRRRRDEERARLQPSNNMRRVEAQELLEQRASVPQFTVRATVVGLFVGTLVCFSNMYFGLQSECSHGNKLRSITEFPL